MPYSFHHRNPFGNGSLYPVPPDGPVPARVYLIGERPGQEECRKKKPFVGISGKYMELCMEVANIKRSDCRINNLVSTFSFYAKPTREEIDRDHGALVADVIDCSPEIIGLVGAWAVENVLNRPKAEMDRVHGVPVRVTDLFGGELTGNWIILPITHPASAVYSPDALSIVLDDILTLGQLLDGEIGPMSDAIVGEPDYRAVNADDLDIILP